jgi:membrane protein DedA with SNARE-associated domain
MRFSHFFAWNAFGAITWGMTYGLLGYYGGHTVINVLSTVGIGAAIVLGVAFVGGYGYVKVRERRAMH